MQRRTLNNLLLILAVILLTLGVISQLFMGGKEETAPTRGTEMQRQGEPNTPAPEGTAPRMQERP